MLASGAVLIMPSSSLNKFSPRPPKQGTSKEESGTPRSGTLAPLNVNGRAGRKTSKTQLAVVQEIRQLPAIREHCIEAPKKLPRRATVHDFEGLRARLTTCSVEERFDVSKVEITRLESLKKDDLKQEEIVPLSEDVIRGAMKIECLRPRHRDRRWSESLPRICGTKLEAKSAPPRISTLLTLNKKEGEDICQESLSEQLDPQKRNMIHSWLEKCNNALTSW